MPRLMRALVATADPDRMVELREVEEPAPAPDEALVEVRAAGVNRGELRLLASRGEGWRPGQDVAGVVVRATAEAGPREGARVVGLADQGGWAERVTVPVSRLAELPDEVPFPAAASLPVAGLTALRALRVGGSLLGRRVLVTGAAGGVGHFAVQIAAAGAAKVAGVAGGRGRRDAVLELGADLAVADMGELEGPYDLILESGGGASLRAALSLIAEDGTVVVFGNSSGQPTELSFSDFAGHARARIYGFFVYESGDTPSFGEDLGHLARLVARRRLNPEVGLEAGWSDAPTIFAALRDRRVFGKAVLLVGERS